VGRSVAFFKTNILSKTGIIVPKIILFTRVLSNTRSQRPPRSRQVKIASTLASDVQCISGKRCESHGRNWRENKPFSNGL